MKKLRDFLLSKYESNFYKPNHLVTQGLTVRQKAESQGYTV